MMVPLSSTICVDVSDKAHCLCLKYKSESFCTHKILVNMLYYLSVFLPRIVIKLGNEEHGEGNIRVSASGQMDQRANYLVVENVVHICDIAHSGR